MIIVSQDKETVVNFENIIRIKCCKYNGKNYIQCDFPYGNYEDLGTYKTEERANKILKEIIKAYKIYKGRGYTIGDIQKLLGDYEYGVYEMPEE